MNITSIFFRIKSIEHGWLFAELDTPSGTFDFANSCYGSRELPRALLQVLICFLEGGTTDKWLCWNAESQAGIWHMYEQGGVFQLEIYSVEDSFGLPVQGDILAEKVKFTEPILKEAIDFYSFARSVGDAFKEYKFGEKAEQWRGSEFGDFFPHEEYRALRRTLRRG